MLVLVNPAAKVRPRPSLEQSYRRHEALVAGLASHGGGTRLPLPWHASSFAPASPGDAPEAPVDASAGAE